MTMCISSCTWILRKETVITSVFGVDSGDWSNSPVPFALAFPLLEPCCSAKLAVSKTCWNKIHSVHFLSSCWNLASPLSFISKPSLITLARRKYSFIWIFCYLIPLFTAFIITTDWYCKLHFLGDCRLFEAALCLIHVGILLFNVKCQTYTGVQIVAEQRRFPIEIINCCDV